MEKKLRHSRQRERIYQYVCSTEEHPSAEMVYTRLKEELPNLSLGTVYRNLKLLEESGKVRRVTTLQNTERYDARCCDHAHFVCESCGRVKDLSILDAESARDSCKVGEGDQVQWVSMTFGGICADCAGQSSTKSD